MFTDGTKLRDEGSNSGISIVGIEATANPTGGLGAAGNEDVLRRRPQRGHWPRQYRYRRVRGPQVCPDGASLTTKASPT